MQVNNVQDYVTQLKRQIIAKSLTLSPPPLKQRSNTQYIGVVGNKAQRYIRFIPGVGVNTVGPAVLGATFTSACCVPANTSTTTYLV